MSLCDCIIRDVELTTEADFRASWYDSVLLRGPHLSCQSGRKAREQSQPECPRVAAYFPHTMTIHRRYPELGTLAFGPICRRQYLFLLFARPRRCTTCWINCLIGWTSGGCPSISARLPPWWPTEDEYRATQFGRTGFGVTSTARWTGSCCSAWQFVMRGRPVACCGRY